MQDDILIHELMHVWQNQKFGANYIPLALKAQYTVEGYNYGGLEDLCRTMENGGSILDYNFEQQADIVMDYFRLVYGLPVRWGSAGREDLKIYTYFVKQINPGL